MAFSQRSLRTRRPVAQRRKRIWATGSNVFIGVDGTNQVANILSQFESDYGADLVGATVARTFCNMRFIVTTPPAMSGLVVGLIMTTETTTDPALNPTASGSRHLDWSYLSQHFELFDPVNGIGEIRLDVKSMRKMEELGSAYRLVLQGSSGDVWNVQTHTRTQLLLP